MRSLRISCRAVLPALMIASLGAPRAACPADVARFEFLRPEAVTGVDWTATAQLGASGSFGNTAGAGLTGQAALARKDRWNRFALGADVGLTRSRVIVAADADGEPGIGPGELRETMQTTRQAWSVRGRYDRYLSTRASLYGSTAIGADRPAGKRLAGGGQLGFGTDLIGAPGHTLRVEAGYDLTYEDQLTIARPVAIHSARLFTGYGRSLGERLAATVSAELLTNLNVEGEGNARIQPFDDTRLVGAAALTAQVVGRLNVALRVSARWDGAPAPRPPPPGTSFEAGYAPPAERLDATTDLVLIANLF